ncbi:MAG: M56 family metallopeptidase [Planctomycetota bacterium]|jgi:bla regulator protein BlaR1
MESFGMQLWPFFEWLLQTTAQASLLIFLILLVQLILRGKLGVRWHYCLWTVLLIRLLMPWAPESRISIFNLFQMLFERGPTELVSGNSAIVASTSVTGQQTAWGIFVTMLPIIWLVGALVLIFYMFVTNLAFWRSINRERPLDDRTILELFQECKSKIGIRMVLRIVVTDKVKSPALFGFVRPHLLLPHGMIEAFSLEELRCVFLHELAHLKRHDILVAHIVSLLQILHWFNPLIWLAFYRMRADRELACDALVLSTMNVDEPKKYGRTIISLVELFHQKRYLPGMVGIMENKSQLKRRITMIAKFKKMSKKWSLLAVLVIALIAIIALTNAKSSSEGNADNIISNDVVNSESTETKTDTTAPMGYGSYRVSPPPQGYGGYSERSEQPMTRGKINKPEDAENNTPTRTGMGWGVYGGGYRVSPPPQGYRFSEASKQPVFYGASRAKDTEGFDSPDSNTPAPTP